eukprot:CAMPEP_0173468718 /NCGR_PEP_ID=MMETSP1357-20121228/76993_1 /TAXON_ID=77926 /ORGANISM="Hemiselmis rufescens, Strain PCC563" /LENGTH=330 /DNA_ID=CAMNT_0014436943 /DNA_START=511 /DNA_END=1503 /DNA_ORIENTATION=-
MDSVAGRAKEANWVQLLAVGSLFVLIACIVNSVVGDESVPVLSRGKGVCAGDRDLLQKSSLRCRVVNKLAVGFLNGEDWVRCADFTRGAKLLRSRRDEAGDYWYSVSDMHKIAFFYSTCAPSCASSIDTYEPDIASCDHGVCDGGVCRVRNGVALGWYRRMKKKGVGSMFFFGGDSKGDVCVENPKSRVGIQALDRGTSAVEKGGKGGEGQVFYNPEDARQVSLFYSTCHGQCACLDALRSDGDCEVQDEGVRIFFDPVPHAPGDVQGRNGVSRNVLNAQCQVSNSVISRIRTEGKLKGDWRHMTYHASVAHLMRDVYSTCKRHVPCPAE